MKPNKITPWIPIIGFGYVLNSFFNYEFTQEEIGLYDEWWLLSNALYQALFMFIAGTISFWFN